MTEGYTRGPWVATGDYCDVRGTSHWDGEISSANNYPYRGTIARIISCDHIGGITRKEAEANARLIAASPDLLEALKATLEEIERVEADVEYKLPCGDKARAAIAKAEGSAP